EKGIIAEMVQQLAVRLGDQGQENDLAALAGLMKGDLPGQRGLAAAREALHQIKAAAGEATAQYRVETGHAGRYQGQALVTPGWLIKTGWHARCDRMESWKTSTWFRSIPVLAGAVVEPVQAGAMGC